MSRPTPAYPLAVAVGNASLLGAGYLMLGRRWTAVATGGVTLGLVILLGTVRSLWTEAALVVWWAAMIEHGFLLAGGRTHGSTVPRQRIVALGIALPVLLGAA